MSQEMYPREEAQQNQTEQFDPSSYIYDPTGKIGTSPNVPRRRFIRDTLLVLGSLTVGGGVTYGAGRLLTAPAQNQSPSHAQVPKSPAPTAAPQNKQNTQQNQTPQQEFQLNRQAAIEACSNEATTITQSIIQTPGAVIQAENGVGSATYINNTTANNQPYTYDISAIYGVGPDKQFIAGSVQSIKIAGYRPGDHRNSENGTVTFERSPVTGDWSLGQYEDFTTATGPTAKQVSTQIENLERFVDLSLSPYPLT